MSRIFSAGLAVFITVSMLGCEEEPKTRGGKSQGGLFDAGVIPGDRKSGESRKSGGNRFPSADRKVFESPKVTDIVQAAGEGARGKAVVIGNVKITLPMPPSNRAMLEFDFHPLQPPISEQRYMCLFRSASGEFTHVEITGELWKNKPPKPGRKVGYRLITPQFRPPFTVVVRRWPLRGNRSQAVEVSNRMTVR